MQSFKLYFLGFILIFISNVANAQYALEGKWNLHKNDKEEALKGSARATADSIYFSLDAHLNQVFGIKYKIDKEGGFGGQAIADLVVVIQGKMVKGNNDLFEVTLRLRNMESDERHTYSLKGKRKE